MSEQAESDSIRDDLQELFDTSVDLMCVAGADGYLKRVNPAWTRTLGFLPEELMAEPFLNFIHPEDRAASLAAIKSSMNGSVLTSFKCRYRHKDGTYRVLEWTNPGILKRGCVFGVARDVTERERQQQRLEHLFDAGRILVYNAKAGGDYAITYMSENVTELFGYTAQEFLADPNLLSINIHPDDAIRVLNDFARIRDDGRQVHQYRFRHKDGSYRWVADDCRVVRNLDGNDVELLGFMQDITDRKHAEELVRKQSTALTELSTPLIPIDDDVLVMPLIGTMDSQRANQVLSTLLEGVSERRARAAILDITGVSVVDTQVANALLGAAKAVRLLGAEIVLTGIRPEVARTLVGLGVELTDIVTEGTLQAGIAYAKARAAGHATERAGGRSRSRDGDR